MAIYGPRPGSKFRCSVCGEVGHNKLHHDALPSEKRCQQCGHLLPLTAFSPRYKELEKLDRARAGGSRVLNLSLYHVVCKECMAKRRHGLYRASVMQRLSIQLANARCHAREEGVPFDLTREHLYQILEEQAGRCYYTGRTLTTDLGSKSDGPSIDRKDHRLGYVPGNICICTTGVNLMKRNRTSEEFIALCEEIVDHCRTTQ